MIGCGGTMMMEKYAAADTMWVLIGAFLYEHYIPWFYLVEDRYSAWRNNHRTDL